MDLGLVKIRLQQINQESGGLGAIHLLLIAAGLIWLEYSLYIAYNSLKTAGVIFALIGLALLSTHLLRPDSRFVWHQLPHAKAKVFAEYWLFSLPFVLPALPTLQFWILALHALVCWGLSRWSYKRSSKGWYFPALSKWIPAAPYLEWLSSIRRYWIYLLPLYALTWAFCWLRGFPILSLWGITLILANFYTEGEPLNILRIRLKDPARFLWWKIRTAWWLMSIIYLPPLVVNALFHSDIWYFHLIFFLMQLVALWFLVVSKYSIYQSNTKLSGNAILQAFALMGTIIPFLAPLPLILCFWYSPKAIRQLQKFLICYD